MARRAAGLKYVVNARGNKMPCVLSGRSLPPALLSRPGQAVSEGAPAIRRIDSRLDYWVTANRWEGMEELWGKFYAQWTSHLKIVKGGDYQFSLGTTDVADLQWFHEKSGTWATYTHDGAAEFSYSSTGDHTPETARTLTPGFHRFRIVFKRTYDKAAGVVLKVKGPDFGNGHWKVVPSSAMYLEKNGCLARGASNKFPKCLEGFVVPAASMCTVSNEFEAGNCADDQVAYPAQVKCATDGTGVLERFRCNWDAVESEKVTKAGGYADATAPPATTTLAPDEPQPIKNLDGFWR